MKKLLLLLLLTSSFFANANSIEGAFGYKLGQVVEYAIESNSKYEANNEILFQKKPLLPGDFKYFLYTTLKDKKVSYIRALSFSDSYSKYYCSSNDFLNIMKIYELKYGKFAKNFFNEKDERHTYKDNGREIRIECIVGDDLNTIDIGYFDWKLHKERIKEYDLKEKKELKEKEQQFIEEAAEYDI